MLPSSLVTTTALLYYACFGMLLGIAGFVLSRNARSWRNNCFALTALSLLVWQATQFVYERSSTDRLVLWLGRANFAAIVFTVFFAYLLVRAVAGNAVSRRFVVVGLIETIILGLLSVATPLVDKAEVVHSANPNSTGSHTTVFGFLAVLYFAHVLAYLAAAVLTAFRLRSSRGISATVRDQLLLLGGGMLATGVVGLITNVVLPYGFGDFRFIDAGPISTILFLLAVAYAIIRHHLFDIRVFIRRTVVWGILLSLVMAIYGAILLLVTDHLTEGANSGFVKFGVLIIAGSFDPLRRFLEQKVDRLLFPAEAARKRREQHRNVSAREEAA